MVTTCTICFIVRKLHCPHSVIMCFMQFSHNKISLNSINTMAIIMETNCVSCVVGTLNIILMYFIIQMSKPSQAWNSTLIFMHFSSHGQVRHIKEVTYNDGTDGVTFIRLGNGVQDVTYGRNLIPSSFCFTHQQ